MVYQIIKSNPIISFHFISLHKKNVIIMMIIWDSFFAKQAIQTIFLGFWPTMVIYLVQNFEKVLFLILCADKDKL